VGQAQTIETTSQHPQVRLFIEEAYRLVGREWRICVVSEVY
jgi:hypothetical protein